MEQAVADSYSSQMSAIVSVLYYVLKSQNINNNTDAAVWVRSIKSLAY
jgi:hypothetical protein